MKEGRKSTVHKQVQCFGLLSFSWFFMKLRLQRPAIEQRLFQNLSLLLNAQRFRRLLHRPPFSEIILTLAVHPVSFLLPAA